jgi:hypothetical protein
VARILILIDVMRVISMLLTFSALGACADESTAIHGTGLVRFDAPAIGQVSRYRVLVGQKYRAPDESPFQYVDGTLIAEVIAVDGSGFRIREAFEDPGKVPEAVRSWIDADATAEYDVRIERSILHIKPASGEQRSRLFPWRDPALPLEAGGATVELFGWKTTVPYREARTEAVVLDASLLEESYPRLEVVIDNEPMQVDGPGSTWVYAADAGLVRSSHYSWWTNEGIGFDLIPE